jgi:hypothetical protein
VLIFNQAKAHEIITIVAEPNAGGDRDTRIFNQFFAKFQ